MDEEKELKRLLAEVLYELCNQFTVYSEDDEDYLESLCQRARELGVNMQ